MTDLTVIYYTANRIPVRFQVAVMEELRRSLSVYGRVPIVALAHWHQDVTHAVDATLRPDVMVWVRVEQTSIAQVYRNILQGCELAQTEYVAFCEDDTLYVPEHFAYRPADADTFAYNERRVVLTRELAANRRRREAFYYFRPRTQMAMGLCRRTLMIETLRERFAKYPNPPLDTTVAKKAGWGEPGRYEKNLGLPPRRLERRAWTERPNVTFNHGGLMGRRRVNPDDARFTTVEPWGDANALWERIHG